MNLEHLKLSMFAQLFKKYVIILLVFAILNIVFAMLEPWVLAKLFLSSNPSEEGNSFQSLWFQNSIYLIRIFFNFLTMLFLFADSKKMNFIIWALLILTLIEREIGVVLFLLFVLYRENVKVQAN